MNSNKDQLLLNKLPDVSAYTEHDLWLLMKFLEIIRTSYHRAGYRSFPTFPFIKGEFLDGDHTMSKAIWLSKNFKQAVVPYKFLDIVESFQDEPDHLGKFKTVYQCNVDIIDHQLSLHAEAECITICLQALNTIGITDYTVAINHFGLLKAVINFLKITKHNNKSELLTLDKLDKSIGHDLQKIITVINNFLRKGPLEDCNIFIMWGPQAYEAIVKLQKLWNLLQLYGVNTNKLKFCPQVAQKSEHYTGIAYEIFLPGKYSQYGSIARGGRYTNITNSQSLIDVGLSIELTHLYDILKTCNCLQIYCKCTIDILILCANKYLLPLAIQYAPIIRTAGWVTEIYTEFSESFEKPLKYANEFGIPLVFIIKENNIIYIKNLRKLGDQYDCIINSDCGTILKALDKMYPDYNYSGYQLSNLSN